MNLSRFFALTIVTLAHATDDPGYDCATTTVASNSNNDVAMYTALLDQLYHQTDRDRDCELNVAEFTSANAKLGISNTQYTNHAESYAVVFAALDTNDDQLVSKSEFAACVDESDFSPYRLTLINAFTNGVMDVPNDTPIPTSEMNDAQALITVSLIVSGTPDAIYNGQRTMIKDYFAAQASVSPDMVLVTFLAAASRRRLDALINRGSLAQPHRALQAAQQTEITATIFCDDAAEADAALAQISVNNAQAMEQLPAFDGMTVVSVSAGTTERVPPLERQSAMMAAVLALVLGIAVSISACFFAGKSKRGGSCCSCFGSCCGGCCGLNGKSIWAKNEFIAVVFILSTLFLLYTEVQVVTDAIVGMVTVVIDIANYDPDSAGGAFMGNFTADMPREIIDMLEDNLDNMRLLPVATLVPGLLACLFLSVAGLCAASSKRKGKFCCTRLIMLMANLFLLMALVFYTLFAAYAVIMSEVESVAQASIEMRGMCITIPNIIEQRLTDGQAALDRVNLVDPSVDMSEVQTTFDSVRTIGGFVTDACGHMEDFLSGMFELFVPGCFCICAIVFSLYVNWALCCSVGCFCSQKTKPKDSKVAVEQKESTSTTAKGDKIVAV